MSENGVFEAKLGLPVVTHKLVVRIEALNRITQRADDLAAGEVSVNSLSSLRILEICRANLAHYLIKGAAPKVLRIPREASPVVAREEEGLLRFVGEANMPAQSLIQPG